MDTYYLPRLAEVEDRNSPMRGDVTMTICHNVKNVHAAILTFLMSRFGLRRVPHRAQSSLSCLAWSRSSPVLGVDGAFSGGGRSTMMCQM